MGVSGAGNAPIANNASLSTNLSGLDGDGLSQQHTHPPATQCLGLGGGWVVGVLWESGREVGTWGMGGEGAGKSPCGERGG